MSMKYQIGMILKALFAKYDVDNSGYLDQKQVRLLLADAFSGKKQDQQQNLNFFYKKFDINGDGKFSKQQIQGIVLKILQNTKRDS